MKLTCYGTGSTGNCYIAEIKNNKVLLDAGLRLDKLPLNLNDIDFAFISHEHKDHSLEADKLASRGVYIIYGYTKLNSEDAKPVTVALESFTKLDSFKDVFIFPVKHGVTPCGGIIMRKHEECVLYITDFTVCQYDLSAFKFTDVIVECNYQKDVMNEILKKHQTGTDADGKPIYDKSSYKYLRQINTHMSDEGLMSFLEKLDLSKCECIYLIHSSTDVGDPIVSASMISTKFQKKVGVCKTRGGIEYYGGC